MERDFLSGITIASPKYINVKSIEYICVSACYKWGRREVGGEILRSVNMEMEEKKRKQWGFREEDQIKIHHCPASVSFFYIDIDLILVFSFLWKKKKNWENVHFIHVFVSE